jgi:putative flippase GtrA
MLNKQLFLFIVIGILTVCVDYISYRGIIFFGLLEVNESKAAGFLIGSVFAYFTNKIFTFGHVDHASGDFWRFIVLYSLTLGVNVVVNAMVLDIIEHAEFVIQLAFIIATGSSAILNFFGMKIFVFVRKHVVDPL